jgi:flagellar biosynthesis protein FliQ
MDPITFGAWFFTIALCIAVAALLVGLIVALFLMIFD